MTNKFGYSLLGIILLVESIYVFLTNKTILKTINYNIKVNEYSDTYGIQVGVIGVLLLYYAYNLKSDVKEFTKCPKCKESYDSITLKSNMCPKCHIKTIEIDEYFKKYPRDLEDV